MELGSQGYIGVRRWSCGGGRADTGQDPGLEEGSRQGAEPRDGKARGLAGAGNTPLCAQVKRCLGTAAHASGDSTKGKDGGNTLVQAAGTLTQVNVHAGTVGPSYIAHQIVWVLELKSSNGGTPGGGAQQLSICLQPRA